MKDFQPSVDDYLHLGTGSGYAEPEGNIIEYRYTRYDYPFYDLPKHILSVPASEVIFICFKNSNIFDNYLNLFFI